MKEEHKLVAQLRSQAHKDHMRMSDADKLKFPIEDFPESRAADLIESQARQIAKYKEKAIALERYMVEKKHEAVLAVITELSLLGKGQ